MSKHIRLDTTVQNLEFQKSWGLLTPTEQNYAYFLSKASWAGAKMVFNQLSYESPALFVLFQLYFSGKDFQALEESAILKAGATADEWKRFIAYVAGFYSNMSNYHSFGNAKFVPEIDPELFHRILLANQKHRNT